MLANTFMPSVGFGSQVPVPVIHESDETRHFGMDAEIQAMDGNSPQAQTQKSIALTQMEKHPCVYILASHRIGTLYVGVTSNLIQRVYQHRNDLVVGFTRRYKIHTLVWYDLHESMESAILREKEVKIWQRHAKITLIEKGNPGLLDLWEDLIRA